MRPVETIPGMGGKEVKENDGRGWIQLWYIVRAFVNVTMCPQYSNKNKKGNNRNKISYIKNK
jgi:hypothetical protein